MARRSSSKNNSSANIGFEANLGEFRMSKCEFRTEKMPRLISELEAQFVESAKLEAGIRRNLAQIRS